MTTHENLHVLEHPLLRHKLAILRERTTETHDFRNLVSEIAGLMCYETTRDFSLADIEIETPICKTRAQTLAGKQPVLVPILRAGLGMVDGILALLPAASIGHIGLYRDEQSMEPVEYYCKLPADIAERDVLLLDPMLATGGSAVAAVSMLKQRGVRSIRMLNIVAAPEGVAKVHAAHPELPIYCAALDEGLNAQGYIVPGLGDAGDRIFGTK